MKQIKQINVGKNEKVSELIKKMGEASFGARGLSEAVSVYKEMISKKAFIFMGLAGAMVPAGMRQVITDYLRSGYVHALVITGANITHDLVEALGMHHYQGTHEVSDEELLKKKLDRIYDVFMPNEVYEKIEDFINSLDFKKGLSVREFLWEIGSKIKDSNSILRACYELKIPIFCPAFTDCGLAVMLALNKEDFNLDHFADLREIVKTAWDHKKRFGVFIIGGGVPKNFIMQALQFSDTGADYAIQVTTDRPEPGGLSGATLSEAISWGKIKPKARFVDLRADATIVMPIILSCLKDINEDEK